jgi:magnesium transporter
MTLAALARPEIQSLIDARDFNALKEVLAEWEPSETAELLTKLSDDDRAILFRLLPKKLAADVYEYLDVDTQIELLKAMGHEQVAAVLNEMAPDDRTALLEELPGTTVRQLLMRLKPEERRIAQTLLGYPENSVGRLMTPDYVAVDEHMNVQEVLDYVREHGKDSETLNFLYVTDKDGKLLDAIRMREILLSPLDRKVSDLMKHKSVALNVNDDQEKAVAEFKKFDRYALPVTDSDNNLVGIVTMDDVLDVAEEEATEDIQKFGGVEALGEPYLSTSLQEMVRKRSGWLVVLFLGELLTASAMAYFEEEIARAVVLALFVPLIISSGGNSGSQAATLIIRAMALGEITLRDWWHVMRREIIAGITMGMILGVLGFFRIAVWSVFTNLYGPHFMLVGITVGFSLVGVVLWGTLTGSMLPFVLRRLGLDPATSSAPFVATLVDVTGILIYFSLAYIILSGTLL